MTLYKFSKSTIPRKTARLFLHLVPGNVQLPIVTGRLRGKRWVVGSGTHRFWLGVFEEELQQLFCQLVKPGSVFFDIGAHVGFFTLLASQLVTPSGKVFAFEPMPRNVRLLERHLRLNKLQNVTVVEAAVAEKIGTTLFAAGPSYAKGSMAHATPDGAISVNTLALDDLVGKGEVPLPDFIKMDIEGAELLALKGARELLTKGHPTIFLSTHSAQLRAGCCAFLDSLGYYVAPLNGKTIEETDQLLARKLTRRL